MDPSVITFESPSHNLLIKDGLGIVGYDSGPYVVRVPLGYPLKNMVKNDFGGVRRGSYTNLKKWFRVFELKWCRLRNSYIERDVIYLKENQNNFQVDRDKGLQLVEQ